MERKGSKNWEKLNTYQQEAVLDESPACVVNANVGSGKTTVLIAKILYLHWEKKVPLEDMLVLTFTNKAAREITDRLRAREPELFPEQIRGFGTFHSVAMRLLKEKLSIEKAGWTRDFSVMEPEEETDLALRIIKEEKLNIKYKNRLKKRLEQEYQGYLEGKETSRYRDDLFRLYPLLQKEKQRENKMSFSDLLLVSTELIKEERYFPAWIIADEIQDSDNLQLEFLTALKGEGYQDLCRRGSKSGDLQLERFQRQYLFCPEAAVWSQGAFSAGKLPVQCQYPGSSQSFPAVRHQDPGLQGRRKSDKSQTPVRPFYRSRISGGTD